jgi:hypothetical protein
MQTIGVAFGLKILCAIVVYVVGHFLIGLAVRLVSASSFPYKKLEMGRWWIEQLRDY